MVEKLSELGAAAFIPLITARSVVHPEGRGKRDRWQRLATESAKQSRRVGVMRIEELTKLEDAVRDSRVAGGTGCFLSTQADASPLTRVTFGGPTLTLFIGPEGGWSPGEIGHMSESGLTPAGLTTTILRVETAAVAAAAIVGTMAPR
jgi:16S rRNA (uracil1498-N3)-methyltransferase